MIMLVKRKPYPCDLCEKEFICAQRLKNHKTKFHFRIHDAEEVSLTHLDFEMIEIFLN